MSNIDLSRYVSAKQIRDNVLKLGWSEQQYLDWLRKANPPISDEEIAVLIDQVFHPQPWWE